MAQYKYQCQNCKNKVSLAMSIKSFFEYKKKEHFCEKCKIGKMNQIVHTPHSKIYKDKEAIVSEAKEEAKKVVEKINKGDEKTFIDIYGDKPNSLKSK